MFCKMSKFRILRGFINQRLSAAAEEIFELFERTIAEYEEQLCRSKEENKRQQKLLDAVYNPEVRLHRAEVQQLFVRKEAVPPEHQRRILDQEDPSEPPHVKGEQEELRCSQEGAQLHGPEQNDSSMLVFNPVPVKSENQTQDNRDAEQNSNPDCQTTPTHEETSDSESETDDSTTDPRSGLNPLKESAGGGEFHNTEETSASSSRSVSSSRQKGQLQGIHPGEKPFVCLVCGNRYGKKKSFRRKDELVRHLRTHTGEKPFSCSLCKRNFTRKSSLMSHHKVHTGERPFGCSVCGKRFARRGTLKRHITVHSKTTLLVMISDG